MMKKFQTHSLETRAKVVLVSNANPFSLILLENLLANLFNVVILTNEKRRWEKIITQIKNKQGLLISKLSDYQKVQGDYLLYVSGFGEKKFSQKIIDDTLAFFEKNSFSKKYLIIPLETPRNNIDRNNHPTFNTIYLRSTAGPGLETNQIAKTIVGWLLSFGPNTQSVVILSRETSKPELKEIKKSPPWFTVVTLAGLVVLFPFIVCLLSLAGLLLDKTRALLLINQDISSFSTGLSRTYHKIPLVGKLYSSPLFFSQLGKRASFLASQALDLASGASDYLSFVFNSDSRMNSAAFLNSLPQKLEYFYNELGFIQGEINSASKINQKLLGKVIDLRNLETVRSQIGKTSFLSKSLPGVLGEKSKKTYLILFQNNMELRPTGGFIGSYGLVGFEKGKLIGFEVSDVYSADGQLKGHVEPPLPIKKYLNEASWYLRDSNWDPDFPASATKAEWFLEKEIDRQVDGVVAVDLELVKSFLKISGPLELVDLNLTVDEGNIYSIAQEKAESGFFPGSRQKANFLTLLLRQIINEVTNLDEKKYFSLVKEIYFLLQKRHIQVFIHDPNFQKYIVDLGWAGEVVTPNCPGNCFADWLSVNEANLGVNKANYFIQREMSLENIINETSIKRILTLKLKNTATADLEQKGVYKTYIRLLTPQEQDYVSAQGLEIELNKTKGRWESGVLIEILPGQSKEIKFVWQQPHHLNLNSPDTRYYLYWQKQAGTGADPISVSLKADISTLTKTGERLYNTTLAQDFLAQLFLR